MNKKFLSLVLALVMVLGSFTSVFAAETTEKKADAKKAEAGEKVEKIVGKDNKIQYVIDKKIVEGYEDGSYGLDKEIKRSEITRLLVLANGQESLAKSLQGAMRVYNDVDTAHWANGVITVGTTKPSSVNGIPMLAGYPDHSFKPEKNVSYAELAKMLVCLVKDDLTPEMVKNAIWASSWMTWASQLGILDDVQITDSNKAANRADAFTMVYNALYSLKYFHRTPVNETMGIVSQLKNSEITLNQGEKAKTFKITNSTVYVLYNQHNTLDGNADTKGNVKNVFSRAIKAKAITNPEYYYGSLVRVIANDKGEVTHILELGNPRYLALGHSDVESWEHRVITDNVIEPNRRWARVAGNTIETSTTLDRTEVLGNTARFAVAAKVNYNGGYASSISFHKGTFVRPTENQTGTEAYGNNFRPAGNNEIIKTLRLTSGTRYFVADVMKNQLTEVDSVDQALTILGNTTASNWFFDVYAGYGSVDGREAHETSNNANIRGFNEATVVVFNAVQRSNNGEMLLRVKNEVNSKYDMTFEKTNGEVLDKNAEQYRNKFPFDVGASGDSMKLDVVLYSMNNAFGLEVKPMIRHANTYSYPIVEVIDDQGDDIVVRDKFGDTAVLRLDTETSVFLEGQLSVGKLIQFRTLAGNKLEGDVNATNVVSIVSVMPANYKGGLAGSLMNVVRANYKAQAAGRVLRVEDVATYGHRYLVTVNMDRDMYDGSKFSNREHFLLNNDDALRLRAWLAAGHTNEQFRFKVKSIKGEGYDLMYDLERLVNGKWIPLPNVAAPAPTGIPAIKAEIDALVKEYGKDYKKLANCIQLENANAQKARIESLIDGLNLEEEAKWKKEETYVNSFEAFKKALKELQDKFDAAEKVVKDALPKLKLEGIKYDKNDKEKMVKDAVASIEKQLKDATQKDYKIVESNIVFGKQNNATFYGAVNVKEDNCCFFVPFHVAFDYECVKSEPKPIEGMCIPMPGVNACGPVENTCIKCSNNN